MKPYAVNFANPAPLHHQIPATDKPMAESKTPKSTTKGDFFGKFAVIGQPVEHSKSPEIHTLFARQFGGTIEYIKLPSKTDAFAQTLESFFDKGGRGANITLPFKSQAHELCAELTQEAAEAGAVNTVWQSPHLCGANTDGIGFIKDMTCNLAHQIAGLSVLMIGAGGATRGILGALLRQAPAQVVIANRTVSRAEQLAVKFRHLGEIQATSLATLAKPQTKPFDLIIQASALGHGGKLPPLSGQLCSGRSLCYDLSYGAAARPFLAWASAQQVAQVCDGLGMLVEQAAFSFELWFGCRPQTREVVDALRRSQV